VNWEHLKTYIWLRWRLSVNQVRRSGALGAIIAAILTALRISGGVLTFIAGLLVGVLALRRAEPWVVMAIWDGVVAGFIFFWLIGLLSELQQTELLSLDNFMHLPVSPSGAFLINYAGSSIGLSLILFLPLTTGLGIGLTLSRGPAMLLLFPLIVTFFLMVTAVTYQFRGWLASMMTNPRRRRTIIAVVSLSFILIFQIPNILTNLTPGARTTRHVRPASFNEFAALKKDFDAGRITKEEFEKRNSARLAAWKSDRKREKEKNQEIFRSINMVAPPGWLPYGAAAAAQGRSLPALAGIAGMGLIGIASLRRSYRTTLRMYMGDFNAGRAGRKIKIKAAHENSSKTKTGIRGQASFLEKRLPWISEQASASALMCFRSLMRAPEVKMMLLTPVFVLIVFSGMLAGKGGNVPILVRPLIAQGMAAFMLTIGMTGFLGNQFAFDRSGFRAFVLSCAPRREILLGKNLALLPFAFILMVIVIGMSQWMNPMRPDHLVAVLLQIIPMYLLFCLTGNILSILSPITLKPGSGQPASHQGIRVLFHVVFMLIVPALIGFTLIPLGIEALFTLMKWIVWFPVFLVLGIVQVAVMLWLYRVALNWQGSLLQRREQKILEIVGVKAE
jgi:ABC-2 type transport system permease protein